MIIRKTFLVLFCLVWISACTSPGEKVDRAIRDLRSGDTEKMSQAALQLGYIGPPHAVRAERDLIQALRHQNTGVQSAASFALRKLDTPKSRKALEQASRWKR